MESKTADLLLITSNIGSLFEHPPMISGWCSEILSTIQKNKPNIIAFAFQELGGKDSAHLRNMETFCECFLNTIVKHGEEEDKFYSTGIIFNSDLYSANFTAMGNIILVRQSIANYVSIWDFHEQTFKPIYSCNSQQDMVYNASACPFVHHGKFKGTKSRKGYLRTKLKFGSQECEIINIHLYHDDLNTTAISNIPSIYASERAKALNEIVNLCDLHDQTPAFVFGLDGDFVKWLKTEYQEELDEDESLVVVKEKDFFFKYSTELFNNSSLRKQVLQFDREIQRFNTEQKNVKLYELDIYFGPTYCLEGRDTNSKGTVYATKRIPAWCDRIMFTEAAKTVMQRTEYDAISGDHSTGDHTPVYFFASFPCVL